MMTSRLPWLRIYRNADNGGGSGGGVDPAPSGVVNAPGGGTGEKNATGAPDGTQNKPGADGGEPAKDINKDALAANDALAGDKKSDGEPGKADDKPKDGEGDKKDADADKAAKDAADAEEAKKWEAAPAEIYKDLKYPEGFEVQQELLEPNLQFFKDEKIPPELAQKIVNRYLETTAAEQQVWVGEINNQWDKFTSDSEFYKDGALTKEAEQAYGVVRNLSPETQQFIAFLNKNGGLFHPGFAQIVKLIKAGHGEGDMKKGGGNPDDKKGIKGFYKNTKF